MTAPHNQSQPTTAHAPTQQYVLRAMAANYSPRFIGDHLDLEVFVKAADEIASLRAKVDELTAALREISTHWANQYDHPRKENEMYRGSYGIGVTDGHRACKIIADKALALNSQHRDGEAK